MQSPPKFVSALGALVLVSALTGCAISPGESSNETNRYPSFGLEEARPVDIAVLPIRDKTGGAVPARTLRNELYLGLVEKLYSPISLNYVDVNWVEAKFDSSTLEADGVLQVTVEEWDTSLLTTNGALNVVLQVEILNGSQPGGKPLWGSRMKRRLELIQGSTTPSREVLFEKAAKLAATEILALIPSRAAGTR